MHSRITRLPISVSYKALPLGKIKPAGWLKDQLRLQAITVTGHLDEYWNDIGPDSGWRGGSGESWERGPYYLDGLVPLAGVLGDEWLTTKARPWIEWTLNSQKESGQFGPETFDDPWPRFVMLKALVSWHALNQDSRIPLFMLKYFRFLRGWLANRESLVIDANNQWAYYRVAEALYVLAWLYAQTQDTELTEIADELMAKSFDWSPYFREFPYKEKAAKWEYPNHVVNDAMAVKDPIFRYLFTGKEAFRESVRIGLDNLKKYHGFPTGIFSGDECLAGDSPVQGTETCAVVELMFSLELLAQITGEVDFLDQLETIAFNALPACFTPDFWGHCYDQSPNQVLVSLGKRPWTTNFEDSNLFGLEPNYGCCTANLHQGWPKFVARMWAESSDGLAALAYGPCQLNTQWKGVPVKVSVVTGYPFREFVQMTIQPDTPLEFSLSLRIPGWCQSPKVCLNGRIMEGVSSGSFFTINRVWTPGDMVELSFPMELKISRWHRQSCSLQRGPLVFVLPIGESWKKLYGSEPFSTWEVHPTTPWAYGLHLKEDKLVGPISIKQNPLAVQPFDSITAPVQLQIEGVELPEWKMEGLVAAPVPENPKHSGKNIPLTLIPYGCARLRITEFPVIK